MLGAFALYVSALAEVVMIGVILAACGLLVLAVFAPLSLDAHASGRAMKTGGGTPPPPHSPLFEGEVLGCRLGPDPLLPSASGPRPGGRSARSGDGSARARTALPTTRRRSNSSESGGGLKGSAGAAIGTNVDVIS